MVGSAALGYTQLFAPGYSPTLAGVPGAHDAGKIARSADRVNVGARVGAQTTDDILNGRVTVTMSSKNHSIPFKTKQVKDELDRSLDKSTREVAEEMLRAEEQANLLEYEVGQAIFQRLGETSGASVRKFTPSVPYSSKRVYYPFDGEYWTEELPYYKFNIEDRCIE